MFENYEPNSTYSISNFKFQISNLKLLQMNVLRRNDDAMKSCRSYHKKITAFTKTKIK